MRLPSAIRFVKALASLPKYSRGYLAVWSQACPHRSTAAFARGEQKRVAVYDALNIFNIWRCDAGIGWIEESCEQRDEDDAR
jgi:hypothetical protein